MSGFDIRRNKPPATLRGLNQSRLANPATGISKDRPMRLTLLLLATTTLAACSGGGPTTVGGNAVQGGNQGGNPATPQSQHTFVNPTEPKTYQAIGGAHSYQYSTDDRNIRGQYAQLYAGDESTARNSGITVEYNPRDAIFKLTLKSPLGGVDQTLRFQDPLHRTAFGGVQEPQTGTPNITGRGIQYLEAGGSTGGPVFGPQSDFVPIGPADATRDIFTFFYQKPGTTTNYVTYAGYVRNNTAIVREFPSVPTVPATSWLRQNNALERAAFVFGERSGNGDVPRTGTGSFTGEMIATMVFNDQADIDPQAPTYFQWIIGNSTTNVDFAANTFTVGFTGTARAPQFDVFTNRNATIQSGASFTAAGSGRVDLVNAGGFLGQINSASFVNPGSPTTLNLTIAGSSVDGAFFGPTAQEVGGGFRIVGGVPDERIDILGAFTGKRN
jgi:hypothetical protein